jgi:hypothetical protein
MRAAKTKDPRILAKIADRCLIAKEAKYHLNCYRKFPHSYKTTGGPPGRKERLTQTFRRVVRFASERLSKPATAIEFSRLREEVVRAAAELENKDATGLSNIWIQRRLCCRKIDVTLISNCCVSTPCVTRFILCKASDKFFFI